MDFESKFKSYDKRKLVKQLERHGISANVTQSKTELVRMLILAKKANQPTKKHFSNASKDKFYKILANFLGFCLLIFTVNFVYQQYLERIESEMQIDLTAKEPQIFEKGNQTFVVYNHPLVRVQAIYDENCKRPECDINQNLDQIKSSITPLFEPELIHFDSRKGKHLAEEYDLNLLPVFLFDQTVRELYDFEQKVDFFTQNKDVFQLQTTPNRVLEGPELVDSKIITENSSLDSSIKIIVYMSPSSVQSSEALPVLEDLAAKFGDKMLIAIKYYNTGGNDFLAATALECFYQQDEFLPGLRTTFNDQNNWTGSSEAQVRSRFKTYARKLVNYNEFVDCFENPQTEQIVRNHFQESGELGVIGAPTFFINNQILVGNYELDDFAELVDQILKSEKVDLSE